MPSLIPKLFSPKGKDDVRQCSRTKGKDEGKTKLWRRDSNPEERFVEDFDRTECDREDVDEVPAVSDNMENECTDLLDNGRYYDNDKSNSDTTENEKTKREQNDSIYGSMSDIDSENANSAERKFACRASSGARKDEFPVVRLKFF